jgi:peptidoglycan hydrolase-like protein with peptidoglycan-binding domain
MAMPTLRYGDGFADIAPDLRDFVKILQLGLKNLGYSINTDGLFSRETEKVVIVFQQSKSLPDDGIVRETTWNSIARNVKVRKPEVNIPIDTSSESQYPVLQYRDGYSTTTPHLGGAVKKLQSLLKQLGYSVFEDGLFNKATEDAVKSFQRSAGLPNNGIVRENTWQALEQQIDSAPPPTTKYPLLKLWDGFTNSNPHLRGDVKRLQEALRKLGYAVDVDGLFGMDTEDGVKDFQLANELKTDGVVDKTTWQALEQTGDLGYSKPPAGEETPPDEDIEVSSYSAAPPEPTAYSGYPDRGTEQTPPPEETEKSARGYPDRGSESYLDRGTESSPDQGSPGGYPDRGSESYPDRGSSGSYPDRETESPPDQGSSGGYPDRGPSGGYEDGESETIPDTPAYPVLKYKDGFPDTTPQLNGDVQYLQQLLNKHGYSVDSDGLFGKGTEDAVKSFQKSQGLSADGIVGKSTWSALEKEPAGGSKPKPPDTIGPPAPDPGTPGGSILYYPLLRKNDGFSDGKTMDFRITTHI